MKISSVTQQFISQFPIIDFSRLKIQGAKQFESFSNEVIQLIDSLKAEGNKTIVILDDSFPLREVSEGLYLVKDHINLSTLNPLLGPNDDKKGERFFPVSDLYLAPKELQELESLVVCGLNNGAEPKISEKTILKIHSHSYCFNLVLCALVAAHRGIKVVGLLCI